MIKSKEQQTKRGLEIDLTGPQGNAFYLLGYARNIGKQLGMTEKNITKLTDEMTSGDYENLLQVFDKKFGSIVTLYR